MSTLRFYLFFTCSEVSCSENTEGRKQGVSYSPYTLCCSLWVNLVYST